MGVANSFAKMKFNFIDSKLEKYILWDILQCQNIYFCACYTKSNCCIADLINLRGWSGGAMVLGKLPVPGRP